MSSSFATRTLPARRADGWPWSALYRRSFLLSLAGAALVFVNGSVLRAAWVLGSGVGAWEAHVAQLRSAPVLSLHLGLCAIACFFAWGFLQVVARVAGGKRRPIVLAGGALAVIGMAALALCAGAFA